MNDHDIDEFGNKFWRNRDGQTHREDGPAIEWISGAKSWLIDGNYHREDGPARIWNDNESDDEYWLNGIYYKNIDWWLAELNISLEQKVLLKLRHR